MAARVEFRACDRLEAVIANAELRRIEGEHRRVATDRAGEQKFERGRRAILPAHVRRLADEEFVAALLAFDQFVELPDRGHLDLDETLRSLRRRLFRMGVVASLARIGDLFQFGKAVADFCHLMAPETTTRRATASPPRKRGRESTELVARATSPRPSRLD